MASRRTRVRARDIWLWIRPFHAVYQTSVYALALASKGGKWTDPQIWTGWLTLLVISPALFVINDFVHTRTDRQGRNDRFFARQGGVSLLPCALALLILGLCLWEEARTGFQALLAYIAFVGLACRYAVAKKRSRMGETYACRAACGALSYLVVAAPMGLEWRDVGVAVLFLAFDLQTNIAGDVRDFFIDQQTGVRTFPTVYGLRSTTFALFVLQSACLVGFAAAFPSLRSNWTLIALLGAAIAWGSYVLIVSQGERFIQWAHATQHGFKVFAISTAGAFIAGQTGIRVLALGSVWLIFWFCSYAVYLWSDHRLFFRAESRQA